MIVEPDMIGHWKTNGLISALGDGGAALKALLALWGHCQTRRAWQFQLTDLRLAGICGYTGKAEKLWQAMLDLGFIKPVAQEHGWFEVHDWAETNRSLVQKWRNGARVAEWDPKGGPNKITYPIGGAIAPPIDAPIAGATAPPIGLDWIGLDNPPNPLAGGTTPAAPRRVKVGWSAEQGWVEVTAELLALWAEAYPACNIDRQLKAMHVYLLANPTRAKKSNWERFITNWLRKEQDRGGDRHGSNPRYSGPAGSAQKKEAGAGRALGAAAVKSWAERMADKDQAQEDELATLRRLPVEDVAPAWDWRALALRLYGACWDEWALVPEDCRRELLAEHAKEEGGAA